MQSAQVASNTASTWDSFKDTLINILGEFKPKTVFEWGPDQESSFNTLKQALLTAPLLAHPNYDLPMEIIPDACGYGIAGTTSGRSRASVGICQPPVVQL